MPIKHRFAGDEMAFQLKAGLLKALAHPARLAVIEYLKRGEASVGVMCRDLSIEQSSLSKHLATLRMAGVLTSRQEKASVFYAIKAPDIFMILRPIAQVLRKRLRESEQLLGSLGKP